MLSNGFVQCKLVLYAGWRYIQSPYFSQQNVMTDCVGSEEISNCTGRHFTGNPGANREQCDGGGSAAAAVE